MSIAFCCCAKAALFLIGNKNMALSLCTPAAPVLPLNSVIEALQASVSDVEWMLGEIESQQGWFRFPSFITQSIENLKIHSYPLLYTNESAIAAIFFRGFLSSDEFKELAAALEHATLEERGELLVEFQRTFGEVVGAVQIPKTKGERDAARQNFLALSPEDQKDAIHFGQHFYMSFLSSFHQSLSVMVHGEKLTSLVFQAMAGDDDAFVKAVQIDRRILTEIPHFKERFARSQVEKGGQDFSDKLAYRLKVAPFRGKIRYKSLWYTFSVLEQAGWLYELKYRELLECCDEVGIDGFESRIQSEKHIGNRVREYREFQRRGIVTTT